MQSHRTSPETDAVFQHTAVHCAAEFSFQLDTTSSLWAGPWRDLTRVPSCHSLCWGEECSSTIGSPIMFCPHHAGPVNHVWELSEPTSCSNPPVSCSRGTMAGAWEKLQAHEQDPEQTKTEINVSAAFKAGDGWIHRGATWWLRAEWLLSLKESESQGPQPLEGPTELAGLHPRSAFCWALRHLGRLFGVSLPTCQQGPCWLKVLSGF